MKRILAPLAGTLLALTPAAFAADGKAIFEAQRCGVCHKEDAAAMGPSLQQIAEVYAGKKDAMVSLLEGKGDPLMDTGKYERSMTKPIEKLQPLSAEERDALAGYLVEPR
ncbi:MAG: c-type cytochrome [Deferrisomatales bacterium]|nr:c-type cytochrome [Deferrisomatales bacterium]